MDNNIQSYGSLVVNVTTADGILPIEGASVRISLPGAQGVTVYRETTTDRSGRTEKLSVPTPPKAASLTPGETGDAKPYQTVIVDVSKEGFYSNQYQDTYIFPDILTIQNVHLIPNSGNEEISGDTIYFGNGSDLS